ncbi:unnamed protein product [Orchesella dallaii]|uniref:C2H2-type domain-containing protein n=1 Tax=Orchesella dallaii TaxID=48710 RepID=A0ABP1PWD3_9HEXA
MMKIKWNNCFLCLNELTPLSSSGEKGHQERNKYPTVFLKYLLRTRGNTFNQVLKNVLQLIDCDNSVQLCDKCEVATLQISNLHQELEVVQMKLVDKIKDVKEVIINNSKLYGQNEITKLYLEAFEKWLNEQGGDHRKERRVLEALYAFQTAVFENGRNIVQVPMVFLRNRVVSSSGGFETGFEEGSNCIKTEPVDRDNAIQDYEDDFCSSPGSADNHDIGTPDLSWNTPNVKGESVQEEQNWSLKASEVSVNQEKTSKSTEDVAKIKKHCLKRSLKSKPKRSVEAKSRSKSIRGKSTIEAKNPAVKPFKISKSDAIIINQSQPELLGDESIKSEGLECERKPRAAATLASKRITQVKIDLKAKSQPRVPKKKIKLEKSESESLEIPISHKTEGNKNVSTKKGRKLPNSKRIGEKPSDIKTKYRLKPSLGCETCPYMTKSLCKFEHHLRGHETNDKNFECGQCSEKFTGKQHYDLHVKSHSRSKKGLCDYCNQMFEGATLPDHIKSHGVHFFQCSHCSYCTTLRIKYVKHLRVHGGSDLICDLCPKVFQSRKKYLKHLFDVHKAIDEMVCDKEDCKETYLDPYLLFLHKKVHTTQYSCDQCNKVCKDVGALKAHSRIHSGEKPFGCDLCKEMFTTKVAVQKHKIKEHGAPKFACKYCDKEYTEIKSLNSHIALHEGRALPCGYCDKSFGDNSQLKRHQLTHSDTKNFICEECGKGFTSNHLLRTHSRTHEVDKKFKCSYCPKAFTFQKYLTCHLRIHTGERPFICDLCGKDFNQQAALHVHKRKHSEGSYVGKCSTSKCGGTGTAATKSDPSMQETLSSQHSGGVQASGGFKEELDNNCSISAPSSFQFSIS